jgi:hypothetical protein
VRSCRAAVRLYTPSYRVNNGYTARVKFCGNRCYVPALISFRRKSQHHAATRLLLLLQLPLLPPPQRCVGLRLHKSAAADACVERAGASGTQTRTGVDEPRRPLANDDRFIDCDACTHLTPPTDARLVVGSRSD